MENKLLKYRFPLDKLHLRIGSTTKDKTKANMLVYVDARDVYNALDELVGNDNGGTELESIKIGSEIYAIICKMTINGVCKSDGAEMTDIEAVKGGISDAIKRVAVQFGLGRYLYSASKVNCWLNYEDTKNKEVLNALKEKLGKYFENN